MFIRAHVGIGGRSKPWALEWRAPTLAINCLAVLVFSGLHVYAP
jgi:hypothetical protein